MADYNLADIEAKYGIRGSDGQGPDSRYYTNAATPGAIAAAGTKGGFSPRALVSQVGHAVGAGINYVKGLPEEISNAYHTTAKGLAENLPGGLRQQHLANAESQSRSLQDLERQTYQKYLASKKTPQDRAAFKAQLKLIQQGYGQVSNDVATTEKQYVAPGELAKAGATVFASGATALGIASGVTAAVARGGAGKAVSALAKGVVKSPLQYGLVNKPTAELGVTAGTDISKGDYGDLVKQALLVAAGAAGGKVINKTLSAVASNIFSTHGVLDKVITKDGPLTQYLKNRKALLDAGKITQKTYDKDYNTAKVLQDHLLAEHGNIPKAVKAMEDQYGDLSKVSAKRILADTRQIRAANKELQAADVRIKDSGAPGGYRAPTPEERARIGGGRVSQNDITAITQQFDPAGSKEDWVETFKRLKAEGALKTGSLESKLASTIENARDYKDLRQGIASIKKTTPLYTPEAGSTQALIDEQLGQGAPVAESRGYQAILRPEGSAEFKTADQVAPVVFGKEARFHQIGDVLRKFGVSPEGEAPGALSIALKDNFGRSIDQTPGLLGKGEEIYSALRSAANGHFGAYDPRLLSKKEIGAELQRLNISQGYAGDIRKALDQAYKGVSTEIRGLGPSITDKVIAHFPGMRQYLRVQSAGRFGSLNPFYQAKVATKGEVVAQGLASGAFKIPTSAAKEVEASLRRGGIGNADFLGSEVSNVAPGLISKVQQNQAQRLTQALMDVAGAKTVRDVYNNPELKHAIEHGVQSVYGYPRGGFTSSGLAKTLNLVLFPFRFESKVAGVGAKFLAAQTPVTRVALINDLLGMRHWLDSEEGQKWQQDNAELVGTIKYFTPIQTLGEVIKALGEPGDIHLADLGQLGGLPFGVIGEILDHQGVHLGRFGSSPYKDPRTGQIVPDRIPTTTKARFQQGVIDLISSTFTYPGRQLGLSRKTDVITTGAPFLKIKPGETRLEGGSAPTPQASGSRLDFVKPAPPRPQPKLPPISLQGQLRRPRVKPKATAPSRIR